VEGVDDPSSTNRKGSPPGAEATADAGVLQALEEVDYVENWPADSDAPTDRLFGGMVDELEPALEEPDPDDAAP
jgi:hypothetical protein